MASFIQVMVLLFFSSEPGIDGVIANSLQPEHSFLSENWGSCCCSFKMLSCVMSIALFGLSDQEAHRVCLAHLSRLHAHHLVSSQVGTQAYLLNI